IYKQIYYYSLRGTILFNLNFFFQAEDGIRDFHVTGIQTCALPIYGVFLAHHLLEIGVARAAGERAAAHAFHDVDGVPGEAGIVEDRAARLLLQHALGDEADQIIAFDEAPLVVIEEATVEIAVPGDRQIGAVLDNGAARLLALFRQERIGDSVGQARVGLVVNLDEGEGQMLFEEVDDRTGATVPCMADDLERLQRQSGHFFQQAVDVAAARSLFTELAAL